MCKKEIHPQKESRLVWSARLEDLGEHPKTGPARARGGDGEMLKGVGEGKAERIRRGGRVVPLLVTG